MDLMAAGKAVIHETRHPRSTLRFHTGNSVNDFRHRDRNRHVESVALWSEVRMERASCDHGGIRQTINSKPALGIAAKGSTRTGENACMAFFFFRANDIHTSFHLVIATPTQKLRHPHAERNSVSARSSASSPSGLLHRCVFPRDPFVTIWRRRPNEVRRAVPAQATLAG